MGTLTDDIGTAFGPSRYGTLSGNDAPLSSSLGLGGVPDAAPVDSGPSSLFGWVSQVGNAALSAAQTAASIRAALGRSNAPTGTPEQTPAQSNATDTQGPPANPPSNLSKTLLILAAIAAVGVIAVLAVKK